MATGKYVKGGSKIQKKLADIVIKGNVNKSLKVGFLKGEKYDDKNSTPVALVAFWNNFGTSRIPARPFFTSTIYKKSKEWAEEIRKGLSLDVDAETILKGLGKNIEGDIKDSIAGWTYPENADSTKKRKQFKNKEGSPLIDTGKMLNSVSFEIVSKGGT